MDQPQDGAEEAAPMMPEEGMDEGAAEAAPEETGAEEAA